MGIKEFNEILWGQAEQAEFSHEEVERLSAVVGHRAYSDDELNNLQISTDAVLSRIFSSGRMSRELFDIIARDGWCNRGWTPEQNLTITATLLTNSRIWPWINESKAVVNDLTRTWTAQQVVILASRPEIGTEALETIVDRHPIYSVYSTAAENPNIGEGLANKLLKSKSDDTLQKLFNNPGISPEFIERRVIHRIGRNDRLATALMKSQWVNHPDIQERIIKLHDVALLNSVVMSGTLTPAASEALYHKLERGCGCMNSPAPKLPAESAYHGLVGVPEVFRNMLCAAANAPENVVRSIIKGIQGPLTIGEYSGLALNQNLSSQMIDWVVEGLLNEISAGYAQMSGLGMYTPITEAINGLEGALDHPKINAQTCVKIAKCLVSGPEISESWETGKLVADPFVDKTAHPVHIFAIARDSAVSKLARKSGMDREVYAGIASLDNPEFNAKLNNNPSCPEDIRTLLNLVN